MRKEKIIFMGTPNFASNVLEGLIENQYNIIGVVTQPDQKVGRKQIITPSPVKEVALKYDIPVYQPNKIKEEYQDIIDLNPDLIITCAYGQFIPSIILDCPKYRCINTHGSLLPKYRGGAPIQRAIINGENKTGITIQYMAPKMDEGEILYQKELDIDIEDTNTTLFSKLSNLALEMLLDYLPRHFSGDINPLVQNNEEATYAYNLKKEEEFISFNDNTINVYNHIRGLLDNPGCHCIIENKKYKLMKVGFENTINVKPNLFYGLENDYIKVGCLDGFIKIYRIKPEGKNEMSAKDFYNGVGKNLINKEFSIDGQE